MQFNSILKKLFLVTPLFLFVAFVSLQTSAQQLQINDSGYFAKPGVNVLCSTMITAVCFSMKKLQLLN